MTITEWPSLKFLHGVVVSRSADIIINQLKINFVEKIDSAR